MMVRNLVVLQNGPGAECCFLAVEFMILPIFGHHFVRTFGFVIPQCIILNNYVSV